MTITFSNVETKSSTVQQLQTLDADPRVFTGEILVISNNRIVLDGIRIATIIEHGQVFATCAPVTGFNKMEIR